ncbi:unnamed protein product, partial [Polarella glacialis]
AGNGSQRTERQSEPAKPAVGTPSATAELVPEPTVEVKEDSSDGNSADLKNKVQTRQPARVVAKPKKTMKQIREAKAAKSAADKSAGQGCDEEDEKAEELQALPEDGSDCEAQSSGSSSGEPPPRRKDPADSSEEEAPCRLCPRSSCAWKDDSEAAAIGVCMRCRRKLGSLE